MFVNENPLNHIIPLHKLRLSAGISFPNAEPLKFDLFSLSGDTGYISSIESECAHVCIP
ncbi:hypothetical protein L912_3637 [Escherichia coli SCD1]|nr:hypothetical protein L912_3637 [Escherichia coli SCD1]